MAKQLKTFQLDESDCHALSILAGAMHETEVGVVRTLIRCAMADSPELRQIVVDHYREKFRVNDQVAA